MVVKRKPAKKPVKKPVKKPAKTIRQKQNQKQNQNVNQIVRIYLDERKKSKRKTTAPQKVFKGVGSTNINVSPIFPSQNPLNDMYPLQQPYNPNFYPRPPPLQVPALVRDIAVQNTTPLRSQNPLIPTPPSSPIPSIIDVPTNPLLAPPIPVNNFPNLQNDNANNILPFMDETNDEVSVDMQLPFMDEPIDDVSIADMQLPFMDEPIDDVKLADFNNIDIGNIGIIKPSTTFKTGIADQDTIRIPAYDKLPTNVGREINKPAKVSLPFYTQDPVEDQLAMDFNMGLTSSSILNRVPPEQIPLLPDKELNDAKLLYDLLGGNISRGRPPTTLAGFNKANQRLRDERRADRAEFTPSTPSNQSSVGRLLKKKPLRTPE